MENIVTIDLWSDNWKGEEIINILHDVGIRTAGMHTAINGTFEENVEWGRCKAKEIASICVSLKGDEMKSIAENMHSIEEVEEKPLFLYKVNIIDDVPDTDNKEEEDTEEGEEESNNNNNKEENKMERNVTLNIGCTTKEGVKMNTEFMIDEIGYYTDCTITRCVSFYKGKREDSLKVEVYDIAVAAAVNKASFFARIFNQEGVALTIDGKTHFITGEMTDDDFFNVVIDFERN